MIPEIAMEYYGLVDDQGKMQDQRTLAGLNDAGLPFEKIANLIESHPPGLSTWDEPKEVKP